MPKFKFKTKVGLSHVALRDKDFTPRDREELSKLLSTLHALGYKSISKMDWNGVYLGKVYNKDTGLALDFEFGKAERVAYGSGE